MTTPENSRSVVLARMLATAYHEAIDHSERHGREWVQSTVWLTSLASGAIALVATSDAVAIALQGRARSWALGLLATSILGGVVHRWCYTQFERGLRDLLMGVRLRLASDIAQIDEPDDAADLVEKESAEEVAARIKKYFGFDIAVPADQPRTKELLREFHDTLLAGWTDDEKRRWTALARTVGALEGMEEQRAIAEYSRFVDAMPGEALPDVVVKVGDILPDGVTASTEKTRARDHIDAWRETADGLRRVTLLAAWAYFLSHLAFAAAAIIMVVALI